MGLLALLACAKQVDRFTIDRVVDRGSDFDDVDTVCHIGRALTHPLGAISHHEPVRALVISETVSALCAEADAWEADLDRARAMQNLSALGEARADEVVDARLRGERLHALAASRFELAWGYLLDAWPGIDTDSCPRVKNKDEIVVVLGMVSGVLALFHDRAGGGVVGVPFDRPLAVARATACLGDDAWWSTPLALRAGAWATIPGSAPEGVDPWALLDQAATTGDATGIRVARAIQVLIAANSGRNLVRDGAIRAFAAVQTTPDPDWILLDAYARNVVRQQSDLVWTRAAGHRTEELGVLPTDALTEPSPMDGDDPFGSEDPFGPAGSPGTGEQQESP